MSKNLLNRLGGIFCLALAAGSAWFGVYRPLQAAEAGAEAVSWMPKVTVFIGFALVFGLFFVLTGDRYPYRDAERQKLTPAGWVLFLLAGAVALGGFFWINDTLSRMGYRH